MPHRTSEIMSLQAENARLCAMVERLKVGLDGEPGSSDERRDIVESDRQGANSDVKKPVEYGQFAEAIERIGVCGLRLNVPSPGAE